MSVTVVQGDMQAVLGSRIGPLFDSCVTDAPYHLTSIVQRFGSAKAAPVKTGATGAYKRASVGFMGQSWDGGDVAQRAETWLAVLNQLKPGAHLVAFGGTRTFHRMVCAIEDAGFEIRDMLCWHYGSGFPKSHKQEGGRGTALKPATEPICLARKPLSERSVADNITRWGTGAINIDECRIGAGAGLSKLGEASAGKRYSKKGVTNFAAPPGVRGGDAKGRFPANVLHDGSDEVLAAFPIGKSGTGAVKRASAADASGNRGAAYGAESRPAGAEMISYGDEGSASRFFYSAKAGPLDRIGSVHATIKPVDLMRWLCRLVTPSGGLVLDPFAGSGTTGIAALAEGFDCELIELVADHVADIERKLAYLRGDGRMKVVEHMGRRQSEAMDDSNTLLSMMTGGAA